MTEKPLTIWVLTEGIAGTENQCLGIAQALKNMKDGVITIKRVKLKWPFSWFSPYVSIAEGPGMLTRDSDMIAPPWPDVVIAGGRKAVGPARYIKRVNPPTIIVMVQNPHVDVRAFDLIAAPYHDNLSGPNVVVTDGACNNITVESLQTARDKWADVLALLPRPRIAVMIGGNSKTHKLGPRQMDDIVAFLHDLQGRHRAGLMITVSRRTPTDVAARLSHALSGPHTVIYDGVGDNPYHGFLALADYIICTSDSVSMLSDAATTGKPVFIWPLPGGSAKFDRFYARLRDRHITRERAEMLKGDLSPWTYTPYNDSGYVAEALKKLIEQRNTTSTS